MAWLSLTSRCVIGNRVCSRMLKRGGVAGTIPVLAQRAASEGWEGSPGRPPARGTRTIRMCSFDARNRGSARQPLKMRWGIGKMRAVEGSLGYSPRGRYRELADPRSDLSASQGEESVLADSGREGEITAGDGRVRTVAFLSILRGGLLLSQSCRPVKFRHAQNVFPQSGRAI